MRLWILFIFLFPIVLSAQDNYEIQVYESETVEEHHTNFELHSNYTPSGSLLMTGDIFPSNRVLHETVEITHGFTSWFETGIYFFTSYGSDGRTGYAGSHLRPRIMIPEELHLPVGLSISGEVGYQKLGFFGNVWMTELRPIVDKRMGRFYGAVNATINMALDKGMDHSVQFNPCVKSSFDITKKAAIGMEYYSGFGAFQQFLPFNDQKHLLFGAFDYDFGPDWELNIGVGFGLSQSSDNVILKAIIGRRFSF